MAVAKTEKRIIMVTGAALALFLFSVLFAMATHNAAAPGSLARSNTYNEPKVTKLDNGTYQVYAVARMWKLEPAQVRIPAGSEVEFFITSKDIVHGVTIPVTNVNLVAMYGTINKTRVKFDKPGVYTIAGNGFCGAGHGDMQMQVIVEGAGIQ